MKKITLFYLSIVLFATFAAFVYQKMNGAIYFHEWYQSEYETDLQSLTLIERYTLTYTSTELKNLQWLNWFLIIFIATFPLVQLKQYSRYKEVFLSMLVAVLLGSIPGMADLMQWFGNHGEWHVIVVGIIYLLLFPGILLIEMIGLRLYFRFFQPRKSENFH